MTGFEPGQPSTIPDTAFQIVTLPSQEAGPFSLVGDAPTVGASPTPERTPDDRVLLEPVFATPPPDRAQPSLAAPKPVVVAVPTPTPKPRTTRSISGNASWYCRAGVSICTNGYPDGGGFDAYAAAGPRLRAALGDWRGRIVYVDGIRVRLVDWCQCYAGESNEKLLDLYYDVFSRTGSPVTVRW